MKVLKDKKLIDKFLNRGVEKIYPSKGALEKMLLSGKRLRVYQGFDPTGKFLHVGHAMGIRALRILQQLGHQVIFLVGDYTSKVGDPDKDKARKMLTDQEIAENMKGWKEQASQLIDFGGDNPVQFDHNYKWLSKLTLNDLIGLMSKMTVQQMLERDMFERRLKEKDPIGLQEFIYPLMQGYDSVAMDVDLEIGGNDQTFNMLVGRSLVKAYNNKEKFVRTNKMMDAPDGRTMSKTKGNGINLGDSAEDMYGKAMSYPDENILMGLELITEMPIDDIKDIKEEMKTGVNPMKFKKIMAFEIVKTIKGKKEAQKAEEYFEKTVQKKENPEEIVAKKVSKEVKKLIEIMVKTGLVSSNGEAKRLIKQKAVSLDGQRIEDIQTEITAKGQILKVGKRKIVRLISLETE